MNRMDIAVLIALVFGAYAFAAGSYVFSWKCYKELRDNHIVHLERRIQELEKRGP